MNNRLEEYYERELERLYEEAGVFARENGKIASRLELGDRGSADPHVERLLQGFAFITAGIRQRLDEDFPLLAETLLSSLHPHLLRPRPAMAIMQLEESPAMAATPGGYLVPAGSALTAAAVDGTERVFQTRRDLRLFPVEVAEAAIMPLPPGIKAPPAAASVLRLRLAVTAPGVTFDTLKMRSLRLYLCAPEHSREQLYALLYGSYGGEVSCPSAEGGEKRLGTARVRPVGFDPDDGMLPYAPPTPWGFRMAADYFSFPEKFQFFDIDELPVAGAGRELTVRIFCDRIPVDLAIEAGNFLAGCVPAVNLFPRDVHVALTHETHECRLAIPPEAGAGARIYSVDRVTAVPAGGGRPFAVEPFYPFAPPSGDGVFRVERRRGEETYLSFADRRGGPERWEPAQLTVSAWCCHGAAAAPLPAAAEFKLKERTTAVAGVVPVDGPTRCVFPVGGRESHWRLMSHLVLNHLSLSGGAAGAAALAEMLRLYDWSGGVENRSRLGALRSIEARRRLFRPAEGGEDLADCFLGGLDVTVTLRDDCAGDALFAAVLEAFISGYAALNTPLRVRVTSEQDGGREWLFPLRMGRRRLM